MPSSFKLNGTIKLFKKQKVVKIPKNLTRYLEILEAQSYLKNNPPTYTITQHKNEPAGDVCSWIITCPSSEETTTYFQQKQLSGNKMRKVESFVHSLFGLSPNMKNFTLNSEKVNRWLIIGSELTIVHKNLDKASVERTPFYIPYIGLGLHPSTAIKVIPTLTRYFNRVNITGTCFSEELLGLKLYPPEMEVINKFLS